MTTALANATCLVKLTGLMSGGAGRSIGTQIMLKGVSASVANCGGGNEACACVPGSISLRFIKQNQAYMRL